MTKRASLNLEAVEPSTYQTIDYVNISELLVWYTEVMSAAQEYFRWMQLPRIPNEKWICVYYHDYVSFVRKFAWEVQNPIINNI